MRPPIDRRLLGRQLSRLANASVGEVLGPASGSASTSRSAPAYRIGFTGPPGAGKSSLGGRLALLRARERRVGVLAIDPSSPRSGGAILGDRIRIDDLEGADDLYVRSLASRSADDGLAQNIPELLRAMEEAGFDEVIVETVGVGQAEHAVRHQVDTLILVLNPESGDIVQAMKAGVMELADLYLINKADLPGADRLAGEIRQVLHLRAVLAGHWQPEVLTSTIKDPTTIVTLSTAIDRHRDWLRAGGDGRDRAAQRARYRLRSLMVRRVAEIADALPAGFFDQPLASQWQQLLERLPIGTEPTSFVQRPR